MLLVDVHAHLDMLKGDEIKAVLNRAAAAGVKAIISNSVDSASMKKSLELQQQFKTVRAALGLYPAEAAKLPAAAIDSCLGFIRSHKDKIVAIGEIGLDWQEAKGDDDKERQQQLFERQLELASSIDKPVIVHSRKAEKEVIETLVRCSSKQVVLHAFHGSSGLAKKAVDSGFYFSIPASIVRSSQFQGIVKAVPASRLLTETDAPFLAPVKGRSSEPSDVASTVKAIAEIKGLTAEEAANLIFGNYQRLFA